MSIPLPKRPDCYWAEPGQLLAGEYPGDLEDAGARAKLRALVDAGVRVFIDLTEAGEQRLRPYVHLLEELREQHGDLAHHRLPIRDISVPTVARMREIQTVIEESLAAGCPVYVHCWGGTGRTGTVIGCWLVEQGRAGKDPITTLKGLRANCAKAWKPSPDTQEQAGFVRSWVARAGAGDTGAPPARQ
jgi:hypothetical protein